jgi:hypothetical protein
MMSPRRSYDKLLSGVVELLEQARRTSVRSTNYIMTATYWEIGRRIVVQEQGGSRRAVYGEELLDRLSKVLSSRFGCGFGRRNLFQMRAFYLVYPQSVQTLSAELARENH